MKRSFLNKSETPFPVHRALGWPLASGSHYRHLKQTSSTISSRDAHSGPPTAITYSPRPAGGRPCFGLWKARSTVN